MERSTPVFQISEHKIILMTDLGTTFKVEILLIQTLAFGLAHDPSIPKTLVCIQEHPE
jgi:hypothetical protein